MSGALTILLKINKDVSTMNTLLSKHRPERFNPAIYTMAEANYTRAREALTLSSVINPVFNSIKMNVQAINALTTAQKNSIEARHQNKKMSEHMDEYTREYNRKVAMDEQLKSQRIAAHLVGNVSGK
jgi:hypothetical protein